MARTRTAVRPRRGPEPAAYLSTRVFMDTAVTIQVTGNQPANACAEAAEEAFGWFREVEQRCSRFDPASELSALSLQPGRPQAVSPLLFALLDFSLTLAQETGGAFDPTLGQALARLGFDRNYRTGERHGGSANPVEGASFLDVGTDPETRSVTLVRPVLLDLGAVAKGFAIDLAARALDRFPSFAVNAGGDVFARGTNPDGNPWLIGVRHPREPGAILETLSVSDMAVCTSGDYERPGAAGGHHILEPATGTSAASAISVTVLAPSAMVADGLATAAFVLGPRAGIELLERHGVEGLIISPALDRYETSGFAGFIA